MNAIEYIQFFVPGDPAPGGSKKVIPLFKGTGDQKRWIYNRVTDDAGERNKAWRHAVAWFAKQTMLNLGLPLIEEGVPLVFRAEFVRRTPKTHQARRGGVLKPSAPRFPTTKPDVLKLARSTEDALTGVLWFDDSAIVEEHISKRWSRSPVDPPGAYISVSKIYP